MLFQKLIAAFALVAVVSAESGESSILQLRNRVPGTRAGTLETRDLQKRANTFAANCQDIVATSGLTKAVVVAERFRDAITIATKAATIKKRGDPAIDAFQHYFFHSSELSTFPGANTHLDKFIAMMKAIKDQRYSIFFKCPADKVDVECTRTGSLAYTDPSRGTSAKNITVCPKFFTNPKAKRLLSSKQNTVAGWGKLTLRIGDYETGGHTILHELTHLDSVAKAAGLPDENDAEVGLTAATLDEATGSSPAGARNLKQLIVNAQAARQPFTNILDPIRNAESHAAAATEYYMRTTGTRATTINI